MAEVVANPQIVRFHEMFELSTHTHTSRVIVSCSRSPVVGYLTRVHAQDLFKIDFVKFGFIFST